MSKSAPPKFRTAASLRAPLTLNEAKRKLMDLVARRDHTERELRKKLSLRAEPEIVNLAIEWAQGQNWLATPEKLKSQFAEKLARRGKGVRAINQKLKEVGLTGIASDFESELAKATKLVAHKWSADEFKNLPYEELQKLKARVVRFLASRGFESNVISHILKNNLKASISGEELYDEE